MVCSASNNKCSFKKCSIFQELNFCVKGRSEEPPSSRAAKPSPNYYPTETEAAALPCYDKGSPGPVGSMRNLFDVLQQGCAQGQFINPSRALCCACPLCSAQGGTRVTQLLQGQGRALLGRGLRETPPHSHQSLKDGLKATPGFYLPAGQFLYAKCGSVLRPCRKIHEMPLHEAVSAWLL